MTLITDLMNFTSSASNTAESEIIAPTYEWVVGNFCQGVEACNEAAQTQNQEFCPLLEQNPVDDALENENQIWKLIKRKIKNSVHC